MKLQFHADAQRQREHSLGRMTPAANEPREIGVARAVVVRCSRLLRIDGNNPDVWHALGTALAALGDRGAAFTALRNAVLLDQDRAHTHVALGNLLFDTGRLDDALRCFDCAAALTG